VRRFSSPLNSSHLISTPCYFLRFTGAPICTVSHRLTTPRNASFLFALYRCAASQLHTMQLNSSRLDAFIFVTFAHRSAAYHIAACHIAAHRNPALLVAVLLAATLLTSPLLNVCFLLAFCLPRRGPPLRYATLLHSSRRSSSLHDALLLGSAIRNASPNLELFSFGTLPQRSAPHPHALRPQRNASSLISAHSNARSLTYENR
jgi:hypothetical protein